MLVRTAISIVVLFFAGIAHANTFNALKTWSDWEGDWSAGRPECSRTLGYEDALFALFMKSYEWEFTGEDVVIERMQVEDCHAEISYKVEILEGEKRQNGPAHLQQMRLTRQKIATTCLKPDVRPQQFVVSFVAYPHFFETYELVEEPHGPCPIGESIIMQFRKQQNNSSATGS